jgi:hypothetical protein
LFGGFTPGVSEFYIQVGDAALQKDNALGCALGAVDEEGLDMLPRTRESQSPEREQGNYG